jgi:hypothetical protein
MPTILAETISRFTERLIVLGSSDEIMATPEQKAKLESIKKRYAEEPKSIGSIIGSDGALAVEFSFIWIAIEPDGYSHS